MYDNIVPIKHLIMACEIIKVARGWKPGAISKSLLRKLIVAKKRKSAVPESKPSKRAKKKLETKPTLIISKINGEYCVEMQVTNHADDINIQQCTPLIYKIAKPTNEGRIKKLERKKQRLIKEAIGDWNDPYHPEICERTCLRAYKQAVGLLPLDPNNPDCICYDVDNVQTLENCLSDDDDDSAVSSECSSLDVDWEIHFTPSYQP